MKRFTLFILLFFLLSPANAQIGTCTIFGRINDEKGKPVSYVSVAIYNNDSVVTGTVTDNDGKFSVDVPWGQYIFSAEFVGYERQTRIVSAVNSQKNIGLITLKDDIQALGASSVTARRDSRKSRIERTSIDAESTVSGSKGTALDIVKTAPSVSVTADGTVSVRGKSKILVLLDGVPTTLNDLSALPAANISTVDIITNPNAKYDSDGTGGIINIISKKETATGSDSGNSGIISANYGFNHFGNANVAMFHSARKASWRLLVNSRYEDDIINGYLKRTMNSNGNTVIQQISSAKTTFNSNVCFGTTLRPNKSNMLLAEVKVAAPRINNIQSFENIHYTDNGTFNEKRGSDITWNRENLDASLEWRHQFGTGRSEFSISGNVSKIEGHRPSYYYLADEMVNRSNSGGSPFISSAQMGLKLNFAPGTLETGVKASYRSNRQYSVFSSLIDGEWVKSREMSSELIHQEMIPAAYLLWSSDPKNTFSYKAGIRAEYTYVTLFSLLDDVDSCSGELFIAPTLSGTFRPDRDQTLSAAFSRRIGRPTYPQLNPYMSMIDASTFEQGNMNLRPEKSDLADIAYSLKGTWGSAFADLYMNRTSDYITQVSQLKDGTLLMTYINCTSNLRCGLDLTLRATPVKWFGATLSADAFHTDTHGEFADIDIDNDGWACNGNILIDLLPGKYTDFQVQYFLSTPQYYPQFTTSFNHYLNAGVKQSFCKGALTLSAQATDILGTSKWEIHSSNRIFTLDNISRNKSRMVWVGISLNFNSYKARKGSGKENDDRTRLNLGL